MRVSGQAIERGSRRRSATRGRGKPCTGRGRGRPRRPNARQLLDRRDRGTLASARGWSLATYLSTDYLPRVAKISKRGRSLAPTTSTKYDSFVERISDVIGDVPLKNLRPGHVERLRDDLLASGLAPQTVADNLAFLSRALHRAETQGKVGRNVADAQVVDRPVGKTRNFVIITPERGKQVLAAVRGTDPWDAAVALALGMSLRREEVLGFGWGHVDLDSGTVRIERSITYADRELHFGPPKSDAGERTIPMAPFVRDALRRHRKAQSERRLLYGEAWQPDHDLVVDYGDGSPWLPPTLSTYWARFARANGFDGSASTRCATARPRCCSLAASRMRSRLRSWATPTRGSCAEVLDELEVDATSRLAAMLAD